MKLPNFFIVGAAKSGTSSLYFYLKQHPEIYLSPIKETFYFCKDINKKNFKKPFKEKKYVDLNLYLNHPKLELKHIAYVEKWKYYSQLFREVQNEKAIGEICNGYLYSKNAAKNIYKTIPKAKILMILRNPIERAFSHFLMDLRDGRQENRNFLESVLKDFHQKEKGWGINYLYIDLGLYYNQVKRYFDIFPKQNIKVILFDDFQKNVETTLKNIFEFIGVNSSVEINTNKKYNIAYIPRFQKISNLLTKYNIRKFFSSLLKGPLKKYAKEIWFGDKSLIKLTLKDRKKLIPYFEKDIDKLSQLIERDLSFWTTINDSN